MNIFTDFHHAGLLNSLILLFEKRLHHRVYRPIGMEWLEKGFWAVYDHPATAKQFLTLDQAYKPIDGTEPLNILANRKTSEDVYFCKDISSGKSMNKAITFEAFKNMQIDIVIASIPQHIEPFKKLIREYKPEAKLIYQIGNAWNVKENQVKNVMASALVEIPSGVHSVTYHQEFDTDNFSFEPNISGNKITSFINCFDTADIFRQDWDLFTEMEKIMPDWEFRSFGGGCRDGAKHGEREVSMAMREARYIWHTKRGGDGFGHIIHNAFAVGRPPIVNMSYYSGKMAGKLMTDMETCIAIDGLNQEQIKNKILSADYKQLGLNAYMRFIKEVDFEEDGKKIRQFLKLLQ